MEKDKEIEYFRNKLSPIVRQANAEFDHNRRIAYEKKKLQDILINKEKGEYNGTIDS